MAKEKKAVEVAPEVKDSVSNLKTIAKQFKSYMNAQYKDAVAYTPNMAEKASIVVTDWLNLPGCLSDTLGIPGLPMGLITQVYGKKDSGKTTMLMQAIAAAQKQGILPILILTEFKFDFARLENFMGVDPEAILVLEAPDLETGFSYLEMLLKGIKDGVIVIENEEGVELKLDVSNQKCFIFWDSIGGTLSQSELEGTVEDVMKDMGRYAQALKKLVKRSAHLLHKVKDRVGILFLNQVWGKRNMQGIVTDQPYGGEATQHYYALEIHLKKGNAVNMTSEGKEFRLGYDITLDIKKNHVNYICSKGRLLVVAKGFINPEELDEYKKEFRKYMKDHD